MRTMALLVVAVFVMAVAGSSVAARAGSSNALPPLPPASEFRARIDNPWFPLLAGSRYVYIGVKDGAPSRDVVTVSRAVRVISGVPCAVVLDRLYRRGRLFERTTDWYSQDASGNVWYFGEETAELDQTGHVASTEGTWMTGVGGAEPGIFMPARPHLNEAGRQEFYKGHAEDHFRVIALSGTVVGGQPNVKNVLLTEEWTPLEPGTLDHKMYVRGVGNVFEQTVKGGNERAELVAVTRGS